MNVNWQQVSLSPQKVAASAVISKELLESLPRDASVQLFMQQEFDTLAAVLSARIYEDQGQRLEMVKTIRVVDHVSWRHQLVASLPRRSVRRRFLSRLWGIGDDYAGRVREWTLDFRRLALYPEAGDRLRGKAGPLVYQLTDDWSGYHETDIDEGT